MKLDNVMINPPDIQLMDEDKTVIISLCNYNRLLYDSFKLESNKRLYEVTKTKLDDLYNYLMTNKDLHLYNTDKEVIRAIYYDIKDNIKDN